MRPTVRLTSSLPTTWDVPAAIHQSNVRVNNGRLRAKLLVFRTPRDLNRFWKTHIGQSLGRYCLGAVNTLTTEVVSFPSGRKRIEADARFFCVIGLVKPHLTMRIISHEAVHAAFAFAKRRARSEWDDRALEFDEEAVAYPAGEIARGIVVALTRAHLLR